MADNDNKAISVEDLNIIGVSLFFMLSKTHILDEDILKIQNKRDKLFVLLFLYKRNINIPRAKIDIDVAV